MIIKKGTKYYKGEEITKDEFEEYKASLQKHCDTLEVRRQEWAKKEKEKVVLAKEEAYQELELIKNL